MITAKSEINVENMTVGWWIYVRNVAVGLYVVTFLGLVLIALGISVIFSKPDQIFMGVLFVFVGLIFLFIIPARTNHFKQSLRKLPTFDDTYNFTLTDAGLELIADGIESRIVWRKLTTAIATENGILIMPTTITFYWMPRDGFLSDNDFFDAVELVSRSILNTKRVGV